MIELQRHIEILLLTNDCVIVPGLGGFMAHHIDARFDSEDNTFVPPLRTLGFNQNLTMNDSLLVQSYIECYDISYPEALRRLEDEVSELRQHLQTEGSYELTDIGVLSLNSEGNIEFRPCEAGILTPSLYGLGTFEMQPLRKAEAAAAEAAPAEAAAAESPMAGTAATAETEPTDGEEEEKGIIEEPEHPIVIKMSWLRNAVAVAAAVLAFFMIGTPVSNSNIGQQAAGVQQSSIIPLSKQQPSVAEATETAGTDSDRDETTDEAPATGEAAAQQPAASAGTAAQADVYGIVLACQVSQKNADGFVELLNSNGFKEAYITNKKFRRVIYGRYASKDEAASQLRQLRQQSRKLFGEGWVMKVTE